MTQAPRPKVIKLPKAPKEGTKIHIDVCEDVIIRQNEESDVITTQDEIVSVISKGSKGTIYSPLAEGIMHCQKFMNALNNNDYNARFWLSSTKANQIEGIRPVTRTTLEIINPEGFNRFEKKLEETFFRFYVIEVPLTDELYKEKEEDIIEATRYKEEHGYIYLKSNDINYLCNFIRKNT